MTSCTVIVEYTEIGARSALLSTRGASIMPAQFVGDVVVGPDALAAPTVCDIAALNRALALPFGMGLLGDREAAGILAASGICRTRSGPATRLASTLVLAGTFRTLLFETVQLSAQRRRQLPVELARLGDGSVLDRLGNLSTFLRTVEPESYLTRFSRTYYTRRRSRFPAELIAALLLGSGPSPETVQFDFDGVAIACWKDGADRRPYLSACPETAPEEPDVQGATASILEARDCVGVSDLGECTAKILTAAPPDGRGYLWTGVTADEPRGSDPVLLPPPSL
jgi:hypothetical protein